MIFPMSMYPKIMFHYIIYTQKSLAPLLIQCMSQHFPRNFSGTLSGFCYSKAYSAFCSTSLLAAKFQWTEKSHRARLAKYGGQLLYYLWLLIVLPSSDFLGGWGVLLSKDKFCCII